MKATPGQQQLLLKIQELNSELRSANRAIATLESGEALRQLRDEHRQAGERLLEVQTRYESFAVDIARVLTDLELVESRIDRDKSRLATSTNSKDISGIQSELASLENRKSILETSELELLEARDAAALEVQEATNLRAEISAKISEMETIQSGELAKLQSAASSLQVQLTQTRAGLPDELLAVYDRKASRGTAIGRLEDRDCGACRIALTSSVFSDVVAAPIDELPTCPNCEAFLVR